MPYRRWVVLLVLIVMASAALSLFPLRLLGTMADKVIDGDTGALDTLFGAYVGMVLVGALLGVVQTCVNQTIGQGVMLHLRTRLHAHLQRLPVHFYLRTRTGEILSRVTTDVNGIQRTLTDTFTDFLSNLSILLIAFALMFALSWQLALIAIVIVPLWSYPHETGPPPTPTSARLARRSRADVGAPGGDAVRLRRHDRQELRPPGA